MNIDTTKIESANNALIDYLFGNLQDGRNEVRRLRVKFGITYYTIVVLSVMMFVVGVGLLSVPALSAYRGQITEMKSIIAAGFGIGDIFLLFLLRPVSRLQNLMGDMGQITIAFNSFQAQMALRLLQTDADRRETIGDAAKSINTAAQNSIKLIETYFELAETEKPPQLAPA
ncbi:MAG: hypothetical protein KC418_07110 [Anaerolineales bacterium]|nr:hypothetical protein [Anaerolineales bacterium]MCB8954370.1 hypothetical protein [Ardenticatenales bacterium]